MSNFNNDLGRINKILSDKDRLGIVALSFMMVFGSVLEAIGVGLIPAFISFAIKPSSLHEVGWLQGVLPVTALPDVITTKLLSIASVLLISFMLLKTCSLGIIYYYQAKVLNAIRVHLSDKMFGLYQRAPYEWHLQRNSAELLRNIRGDTERVLVGIIMPSLDVLMSSLIILMIMVVLVMNSTSMSLMGMAVMGVSLVAVVSLFKDRLRRYGEITRIEGAVSVKAVQQGFGALVDAKLSQRERFLANVFRKSMVRLASVSKWQTVIQKMTPPAIEICTILGLLLVMVLLASNSDSFTDIFPLLALFGVAAMRLKQSTSIIANGYHKINASRPSLDSVVKDLYELEQFDFSGAQGEQGEEIGHFRELSLAEVDYKYPQGTTNALNQINLEVRAGESIAFVGQTGCGKSTLMNILLGLLPPSTGVVAVNGKNLDGVKSSWYRNVSYIPQNIFLMDDSIRSNVAFALPDKQIDEQRVWEVLRISRLDEFIRAQPEGLDTLIGERGVRLSGGQRQRLGIARALYDNPEVLLMDEATSALDNLTEELVMSSINDMKQGRTLIMIAHRLSTVMNCDRIYHLSNGRIIGSGSYKELFDSSVSFKELAVGGGLLTEIEAQYG